LRGLVVGLLGTQGFRDTIEIRRGLRLDWIRRNTVPAAQQPMKQLRHLFREQRFNWRGSNAS
jgi:hypothetical protein